MTSILGREALRSASLRSASLWLFLFLTLAAGAAIAQETGAAFPSAENLPGPPPPLPVEAADLPVEAADSAATQTRPANLAPPGAILAGVGRPEVCAVWVNAEGAELRTAENCRALVRRLREIHADSVFIVVRAMGDAYYRSELAPFPANWVNENLDPLAEILREAHRDDAKSLRVHAVLNVLPLYSKFFTFDPPLDHLMVLHPEWFSKDEQGNERDADGVSWLDPAIPAVQEHLEAVVHELVARYDVDGVHFSGLRYPGNDLRWGYNPLALDLFRSETGASPPSPPSPATPEAAEPRWVRWRANRLTSLARLLADTARQTRPGILVSASALATGNAPGSEGAAADFQNALQYWPSWYGNGLFDYLVLDNNLVRESAETPFVRWIDYGNARKGAAKILVVVSGEANSEAGVKRLLRVALARGCNGVLLRSYQVPARDLVDGSGLLDFLGRTMFSPDYEMPSYVRNALLASLPPVETFPDLIIAQDLPTPLPIAPRPFPEGAPRPLTEADVTRALLGEEAFAELDRIRLGLAREPESLDIGLLPDEAIPPAPEPVGSVKKVRVQLKNGRSFVAGHLGESQGFATFRPVGQSAIVTVPHEKIESILPVEEKR